MRVAVIGGGAAGFFAALSAKGHHPDAEVTLFEKSNKLLGKVKVSGGGRCNVTNGSSNITALAKAYPRGGKRLKSALKEFNTTDTINWFESRGVALYTQPDGRVFPKSDNSQSVIDCLMHEADKIGVVIKMKVTVNELAPAAQRWELNMDGGQTSTFDKVIIATGGQPKMSGLEWLADLGHTIESPVPSLFTFNIPQKDEPEKLKSLMGLSAPKAIVKIQGTKQKSDGPLLITHWGLSGPAVLKLSAFAARDLAATNYQFNTSVNWLGIDSQDEVSKLFATKFEDNPKQQISNLKIGEIPSRLWLYLLSRASIPANRKMGELGKKVVNKLLEVLTNDIYMVSGKTTFKEEFVTCGGVGLSNIDFKTMQSRPCPNLYFAGEVMDIDGITGGYNFQAAWTTGFIAGRLQ